MAADDQWTCGKGLAAGADLPGKLAALLAARAEVLERHTRALDPSEPSGRASSTPTPSSPGYTTSSPAAWSTSPGAWPPAATFRWPSTT